MIYIIDVYEAQLMIYEILLGLGMVVLGVWGLMASGNRDVKAEIQKLEQELAELKEEQRRLDQ